MKSQDEMKDLIAEMCKLRDTVRARLLHDYPDVQGPERMKWKDITRRVGLYVTGKGGWTSSESFNFDMTWLRVIAARFEGLPELPIPRSTPEALTGNKDIKRPEAPANSNGR